MFPDRRTANPLYIRAIKPCYNLCSNSHIRSDAYLLTNTATKTVALFVAVFDGSPIRLTMHRFVLHVIGYIIFIPPLTDIANFSMKYYFIMSKVSYA